MSTNKEILELIRQLNNGLSTTISEAETADSSSFYRESIKNYALNIFEKAQLLSVNEKPTSAKPLAEIKIIKQPVTELHIETENRSPKQEPVQMVVEKKPVEPVAEVVSPPNPPKESPKQEIRPKNQEIVANDEDTSLNAKIAKYQQPVINVADKMKDTPIKELVKAISISKKFEFINELFSGKAEDYKTCLQTIEKSSSYIEAASYIEVNVARAYQWDENEQLASEFFALVKRRFL